MRHELRRIQEAENRLMEYLFSLLEVEHLRALIEPDERWRKARHPDARGWRDLSRTELELLLAGGQVDGFADDAGVDESALRPDDSGDLYDSATGAFIAARAEWALHEYAMKVLQARRALMGPPAAHVSEA